MSRRQPILQRRGRALRGVTGLVAAALVPVLAWSTPATAASPVVALGATAAPSVPASLTAGAAVRLLPTGDRVVVRTVQGKASYGVLRGPGSTGPVSQLDGAGAHYVIPSAVSPLVGGLLDPTLFDVAHASGASGTLELQIRHTGGAPKLPGVSITADAAGVASGTVTAASSSLLAGALRREAAAVYGGTSTTTFAGITRISTRAQAAPAPVVPGYVMRTLVVKALDATGAPLRSGFGFLLNVSGAGRYLGLVQVVRGEARVSVPEGYYSGAFVVGGDPRDPSSTLALLPLPETRVTDQGQVITVDARRATLTPRVTTPRPVADTSVDVSYSRTDQGNRAGFSMGLGGPAELLRVAPVGAPAHGTQSASSTFRLEGPAGSGYRYDLAFGSGVLDQDLLQPVVAPERLATVVERHDTDTEAPATVFGRSALDPSSSSFSMELDPLAVPLTRTSYLSAPAGWLWSESEWGNVQADDFAMIDAVESYRPGTTRSVTWRHAPLAAQVPDPSTFGACPACRSGAALTLGFDPAHDGTRTHTAGLFRSVDGTPVTHFSLARGTHTVVDQDDVYGVVAQPVGKGTDTFTATLDVDRYGSDPELSSRSHTVMTFASGPDTGNPAPATLPCVGAGSGTGTDCRVLPVLQGRALLPTDSRGGVLAGRRTITVELGRVPGAEPAGVTSGTITLRPAGWFPQEYPLVSAGAGRYSAVVDLPRFLAGAKVDVSVAATDSGGSTFAQTVERAFVVTAPAAVTTAAAAGTVTTAGAGGTAGWTAEPRTACGTARAGAVRCFAQWRAGSGALRPEAARSGASSSDSSQTAPSALVPPKSGYGPADIQAAYQLDPTAGAGQTVAVIAAFDNPQIEADLAVARSTWGLAPCTSASGCFRKINQRGGSSLPTADPGWGVEMALDTQAISASCPLCRILLVEADSPSLKDIGEAVNQAVAQGATIVNNSYGTQEFKQMAGYARDYYTHPGVAQVVSSGDYGFTDAQFPAVLRSAIAVGGTKLTRGTSGWSEKVWRGAGSGCSAYVAKPVWQKDTHCSMRTVADVSAVADPQTGLAVYDTFGLGPDNGWIVVGGTSLSAPLVAGMIALAGNATEMSTAVRTYQRRGQLHDVVGGGNGLCGGDYLCRGLPGYDAPSGNGSPLGVGAL